jgi:hypothetical protein
MKRRVETLRRTTLSQIERYPGVINRVASTSGPLSGISTGKFKVIVRIPLGRGFTLACILPSNNTHLGSTAPTTCALSGFMQPVAMAMGHGSVWRLG